MTFAECYRPATFDDVVGQDKAVKVLNRVLKNGADLKAVPPPDIKQEQEN